MNATGTFYGALMAHSIYRNDRLGHSKAAGCVLGFIGVLVVNLQHGLAG